MGIRNFMPVFILFSALFVNQSVATETEVRAHVDSTVSLPCKVDVKQCGTLHSVKWYKDTSRIYVYSQAGSITRAEGDATDRMTVEYTTDSVEAVLKISSVKVEDEATYKCEITYLEVIENCDVVQIVKLQTLIAPKSVRVLGNDGISIKNHTVLEPKDEGTEVDLICEAIGGKPIPKVTWYNGTTEITRAAYTAIDDGNGVGTGTSKLQLTLSRGDLNARFECKVESPALESPITTWIMVDVNVRPTKVSLSGVNNHVVQGTNVLLYCDVYGARPAATVRWTNESTPITNETLKETSAEYNKDLAMISTRVDQEHDGTFTTKSSLTFKASQWENSRLFHCYAENEVLKRRNEPELHELISMDVRYPPVVSVSPSYIVENETTGLSVRKNVLLKCKYFANPQELKGVVWSKDGKNMSLSDPEKYAGGNIENPPLVIYNVSREDMGNYTCSLRNEVGSEQSPDSIFLNVQYPPDVNVIMEPSLPIKSVEKTNVMLECNVTSGNPSSLLKVRWFLDGDLMKEFPECNYTSYDENGVGEGSGGPFCGLDPSILSLERVDETFAGNYTCQGKNVAGWGPISEPQELVVHYPPSPAKLRYYPSTVVKGASVTLECSVDHEGRPNNVSYLWYRGSHQMNEITTRNFTISPVRLETKSNFTCIAVNEGGQSEPATEVINVYAPPAFIQKLIPYQGVLYSSQHINLTCRVECSPMCSIVWLKDGHLLDTNNNPLYYLETQEYKPDLRKNDFESIESTLVWNMTAWPGNKLNKTAQNSNYTCKSHGNTFGNGVNSTIEIAVDYPPEDLTLSTRVVNVIENQIPDPVKCSGKGHPALAYQWKKNISSEAIQTNEELRLGAMKRTDSGAYICEAHNKHGSDTATVYFNVQYPPSCTITITEKDGNTALVCTADANPQEVTFTWKVKEFNDTSIESTNIIQEGLKSFLILDSSIDTSRTYLCYANNTIGMSNGCEKDVAGYLPWWKRIKLMTIIAAIIVLIICVIIICIIIICLCRRKRADTKYNNPLEMEEREKPEGHSPNLSDQSRWPLRPGMLYHVGKMSHMNISQLKPRLSPFKTTSVTTSTILKYKRNKTKVYARFERLKDVLGLSRSHDRIPEGISEGKSGVVTFKKFHANPQQGSDYINPRKRKKPGDAPNPSSIGDKTRLGAAPPVGGIADPSNNPNAADKGFYENLPFHGMQNPPNKNAFYTLTTPHLKQLSAIVPPQYSATIPHQKHSKLLPKSLFQEQLPKSKSFSSKAKQKKNFQIPLQKCHSYKFQTAESYFQPIKNIHEENLMRNGYLSDYQESGQHGRPQKRDKPKLKTKGPLVLRRPGDYQENVQFQENMQNSVQLKYPQPILGRSSQTPTNKPNGVVYADLDMPKSGRNGSQDSSSSKSKSQKSKPKTEYATLKFNDIGQEIDV
ncbi:hemicentin-1 isoform X3 [Aethina tumida]|uniref:hemicentin-1 isoform X3 n=1 Tax=Aethina tumida TaxID=116153 RepID=UPI0021482C67|nr:hemicentin-1 isoform X3 [Aethina tumida]XP_049818623.1 hemicentin-1 isoform X3 [Aethina tumida]